MSDAILSQVKNGKNNPQTAGQGKDSCGGQKPPETPAPQAWLPSSTKGVQKSQQGSKKY